MPSVTEHHMLRAIDDETAHKSVHGCRVGKAYRAAYELLDPGPQSDIFALDPHTLCCST